MSVLGSNLVLSESFVCLGREILAVWLAWLVDARTGDPSNLPFTRRCVFAVQRCC